MRGEGIHKFGLIYSETAFKVKTRAIEVLNRIQEKRKRNEVRNDVNVREITKVKGAKVKEEILFMSNKHTELTTSVCRSAPCQSPLVSRGGRLAGSGTCLLRSAPKGSVWIDTIWQRVRPLWLATKRGGSIRRRGGVRAGRVGRVM